MTSPSDPVRWTAHPGDAPEALREPLEAALREAPSEQQMKALALRLAALGVGTAAAASAATAKAAAGTATAAGAKTAGALTVGKVLASLAVLGATAAGAVLLQRAAQPRDERSAIVAPRATTQPAEVAPAVEPAASFARAPVQQAPRGEPQPAAPVEPAREALEPASGAQIEASELEVPPAETREPALKPPTRRERATSRRERTRAHQPARHTRDSRVVAAEQSIPSEVELLRKARAALAGRPREAFALTEQHRQHYARGTFVQERDALAIEALLRAGELDMARDLARRFVRDYPSSPHAHRFRETMGL
jgi:hypothetical protein